MLPPYSIAYLAGERVLGETQWMAVHGAPLVVVATTHRLIGWGEHVFADDPSWRTLYGYAKLAPAVAFTVRGHPLNGDWRIAFARHAIRGNPFKGWDWDGTATLLDSAGTLR